MPAENRLRGHNRRHVREDPTAELLAEDRQAAPFVIRQPHSPTVQLRLQNPVLFPEVWMVSCCWRSANPTRALKISCGEITRRVYVNRQPATFSDSTLARPAFAKTLRRARA
jgi:hypothetical protein